MDKQPQICMAALMTAKTVAAISSIQVVGQNAAPAIKNIFYPKSTHSFLSLQGSILHGNICDGNKVIDEVIVGCEKGDSFSISCHGNPIIVENILELLKKNDARIVEPKEIIEYLSRNENRIVVEAKLSQNQAATLNGAKIIQHQTKMGLLQTAQWWLKHVDAMKIEDIRLGAQEILADSKIALYFIHPVKIVLTGPPNSGKSTLFNYLCGKEKAIVTDIAGTTRDWLSAKIRLKNIQAEIFDTAGLDKTLSRGNTIDAESQKRTQELAQSADIVLNVLDVQNLNQSSIDFSNNKIIVLNKCDTLGSLAAPEFKEAVKISAKTGSGVKELIEKIEGSLGIADFDMKKTVCFTDRQLTIVKQIALSHDKTQAKELITSLLN